MTDRTLDRLKWKCRRGLLEMDLVLQKVLPAVKAEEVEPLMALLDLPDNHLWDIVCGRSDDFDPRFNAVVMRLRAA